MAQDYIRYDLLVQQALKSVLRKVMSDVARDGLKGEHHFFITFRTDYPGVRLSDHMREKYPQSITIVLQHEFWDLGVTEHAFEVGLSFKRIPERLLVPFEAVTEFYDPSVEFGLRFEPVETDDSAATATPDRERSPAGKGSVPSLPTTGTKSRKPALATARTEKGAPSGADAARERPAKAIAGSGKPGKEVAEKDPRLAETPNQKSVTRDSIIKHSGEQKDASATKSADKPAEPAPDGAAVVSLDAFRKKK